MTHKFAKYLIMAVGALGLAALPSFGATCTNTNDLGALYTNPDGSSNGFSCTLDNGNITFSNFVYTGQIAATNLGVQVQNPGTDGFGFNFTGGFNACSGTGGGVGCPSGTTGTTDANISFVVTASPGTLIDDVYIILPVSSFTGTGSATYTETFCLAGSPCFEQVENPGPAQSDVVTIAPTSTLTITKDLELNPGSNGSVHVSSFGNQYSTVPEPRAVSLLLGLGLLAGLAFFKRRQATQN